MIVRTSKVGLGQQRGMIPHVASELPHKIFPAKHEEISAVATILQLESILVPRFEIIVIDIS